MNCRIALPALSLLLLTNSFQAIALSEPLPSCSPPSFDLGPDTLTVCSGFPYQLSAPEGYDAYEWSTGSTESFISISENGWYFCTASLGMDLFTDSIFVHELHITTAGATTICPGDNAALSVQILSDGSQWSEADFIANGWQLLQDQGNVEYWLYNQNFTWEAARDLADATGGYLFCANDADEMNLVHSLIPNTGSDGIQYWLGLYQDLGAPDYSEPGGGWRWLDGAPVSYTNWYNMEPSNGGGDEHVGQFEWDIMGARWNDSEGFNSNFSCPCAYSRVIVELHRSASAQILWSTGETSAQISVQPQTSAVYTVTVSNDLGSCIAEVPVDVVPIIPLDLGDGLLSVCSQQDVLLDAGPGYDQYLWNTGETTSSIVVNANGSYSCTASLEGCITSDALDVYFLSVDAGEDVLICPGEPVLLSAQYNNDQWSAEDFIAQGWDLITTLGDVEYWEHPDMITWEAARLLAESTGGYLYCPNDAQEESAVYAGINNQGNDNLQYWMGLYQDFSLPSYSEPNGGWRWVDGTFPGYINWAAGEPNNSTGDEHVAQFEWVNHGIRWNDAEGFNADLSCGCSYSRPIVELHRTPFSLLWSTGETSDTIEVSPEQSTMYYVTYTEGNGSCTDSVFVEVRELPDPGLPAAIDTCGSFTLLLEATAGFETYVWSTGEISSEIILDEPGLYWVEVFDGFCSYTDTVLVSAEPVCIIAGCTYPSASNYNALANFDNGSCLFPEDGCTDPQACNYNPLALVDDGFCHYLCRGCTDAEACNFDPDATENDGSCDYTCLGCTYPLASNYAPEATRDDGSCIYSCQADLNFDGTVNTADLLMFLVLFGLPCN